MIGPDKQHDHRIWTVLVHTPAATGDHTWESSLLEVARVPRVGEYVPRGGGLYRVELVIHPLYKHEAAPDVTYTAELCCVRVSKQTALASLHRRA